MRWREVNEQHVQTTRCYRPLASRTVPPAPPSGSFSPYRPAVGSRYAGNSWWAILPAACGRTTGRQHFACYLKLDDRGYGVTLLRREVQTRVVIPEAFTALLSPPGAAVLSAACTAYRPGGELALVAGLRRAHEDLPSDVVSAAVTQAALRHRAAAKFGADAERMFFTPDGLEQGTRSSVAAHRAARIALSLPQATVIDLGCGIGGDLIAMARAGLLVTGIDRDPLTVAVARANLAALELPGTASAGDAEAIDTRAYDVIFADPARRSDGRRVFDADAYSPPWSFVTGLLGGTACVKVAPGIPRSAVPDGVEAEWVSDRGEVKEAALWSGPLASAARRATLLPSGTTVTSADAVAPVPGPVGRYLYEPDGAVIRAGLVTAVSNMVGGRLLDPRIAHVTSDSLVGTPLASAFEVLEELPYKDRLLRAWLRERKVGALEIKKRGIELDPATLRKRLAPKGPERATLIVTRVDRTAAVYACRRVVPD
jgi:THUMP domain-like/Methyltransferase domain